MEETDILKGRIQELSLKAGNESYLTMTHFLSASEQALFSDIVIRMGGNTSFKTVNGVNYVLYGGYDDSDRKKVFFLPYYMNEEEVINAVNEGEHISLVHIYPKNARFADELTHRDFLGSLMNIGIERDQYGDILTDGSEGYVYVNKSVVPTILEELVKVRHTDVKCEEMKPSQCPYKREYEEKDINIADNRLDCIVAEVFSLSRTISQELIGGENVFADGKTITSNSYSVKDNQRISVKGHGKFIYLGQNKITRKGRLSAKVKVYR